MLTKNPRLSWAAAVAGTLWLTSLAACDADPDHRRGDASVTPEDSPFAPKDIQTTTAAIADALKVANANPNERPIAELIKQLNGYFAATIVGANRAMGEIGCPGEVQAPLDMNAKVEDQIAVLNSYVAAKLYRGLVVAPYVDSAETVNALNAAVTQLGPVITIDTDIPSSQRTFYVGTDNKQAGAAAAVAMRAVLNPGDAIAVFGNTYAGWVSGYQKAQAAEDEATKQGLIVTPRINTSWTEATDIDALRTAVHSTTRNLKGLICVHSDAFLCAEVVAAEGMKDQIKVVGADLEERTKTQMAAGGFVAVLAQRQYYMGYLGVYATYGTAVLGRDKMVELLKPLMVDATTVNTGYDLITPDTYEEYMTYLDSQGVNK